MPYYPGKPRSKSLDAGTLHDTGVRLLQMRFTTARRAAGRTHLRDSPSPSSLEDIPEPSAAILARRRGSVPDKELRKSTGKGLFSHKAKRKSSFDKDSPIVENPTAWVNEAGLVGQVVSSPYRHRRLSLQPEASHHPALLPCHKKTLNSAQSRTLGDYSHSGQQQRRTLGDFSHSGGSRTLSNYSYAGPSNEPSSSSSSSSSTSKNIFASSLPSYLFPSSQKLNSNSNTGNKVTNSSENKKKSKEHNDKKYHNPNSIFSTPPESPKLYNPSQPLAGVTTQNRQLHYNIRSGERSQKHSVITSCISYDSNYYGGYATEKENICANTTARRGSDNVSDVATVSFF